MCVGIAHDYMKTVRTKHAHNIKMITFLHQSGNVDTKPIPDTNAKEVNIADTAIPIVHPVNAGRVIMAANPNTTDSTNVVIRIVVMFDVAAWGVIPHRARSILLQHRILYTCTNWY